MNNENQFEEGQGNEQEGQKPTRLQALKQKATLMGIVFSNNIGEEALAKKIEEKLAGSAPVAQTSELNPLDGDVVGEKPKAKMTLRQRHIAPAWPKTNPISSAASADRGCCRSR